MITYSRSFRDFLSNRESKVASVLYDIHRKYDWRRNFTSSIVTNEYINYITFRNDGTISYLPSGKEHIENANGEWAREGRQNGRAAKVIRKLFTPKGLKLFKDSDFEAFSNQYKSSFADGYTFEILPNDRISEVYDMPRCGGDSSLNSSCMNGDGDYLGIYDDCESLRIVVLKDEDGRLAARALLWKINDEITFMDRFYVAHDYMYEMMRDFAEKNGFYYKVHYKTYDYQTRIMCPDGQQRNFEWTIRTCTDYDEYPYIDTFRYGGDGYLNNYGVGDYIYCNTGGSRDGDNRVEDYINGGRIDEDDSVYIEMGRYQGHYTHIDSAVAINGEWWWIDDDDIVEVSDAYYRKSDDKVVCIDGEWHLTDDCVYSEYTDSWHLEEDCVYSNHHGTYIPKEESVAGCGEYYHEDDVVPVS